MNKRTVTAVMMAFGVIFLFSICTPKKQMLWNGKDFEGWAFILETDSVSAGDVWSVKEGVILCKGFPLALFPMIRVWDAASRRDFTLSA